MLARDHKNIISLVKNAKNIKIKTQLNSKRVYLFQRKILNSPSFKIKTAMFPKDGVLSQMLLLKKSLQATLSFKK